MGHKKEREGAFAKEVTGKVKIYLNDINHPPPSSSFPEKNKKNTHRRGVR